MVSPKETGHFAQLLMIGPNEESGSSMKENIGPGGDENTEINTLLDCDKREGQDQAEEDENHVGDNLEVVNVENKLN